MLYVIDSSSVLTVQSGTEKYIFERLFSEHILKYNVDPTIRRSFLQIILDTRSNNLCYRDYEIPQKVCLGGFSHMMAF